MSRADNKLLILLIILPFFIFITGPSAAAENEDSADTGTAAEEEKSGNFLPLPIFITEPAIGEGLGAALIYFHGDKKEKDGLKVTTGRKIGKTSREAKPPPTATGVFGAYTNDDTAAAGFGHSNSFFDDRLRFLGAVAEARINSNFYVADRAFDFTLEGALLYANLKTRLGDSSAFVGLTTSYADADVNFRTGLGQFEDVSLLDFGFVDAGLALSLIYDTRDNTLMPASGYVVDLSNWHYSENLGGDFNYRSLNLKTNGYLGFSEHYVLGLRLETSRAEGDVPFYAIPYVKLRGIPALRYQGQTAGAVEIELRRRLGDRWAVSVFTGAGTVDAKRERIETDDSIKSIGFGVRYLALQKQDAWVGIDIAEGPEDTAWYIQMGNAW